MYSFLQLFLEISPPSDILQWQYMPPPKHINKLSVCWLKGVNSTFRKSNLKRPRWLKLVLVRPRTRTLIKRRKSSLKFKTIWTAYISAWEIKHLAKPKEGRTDICTNIDRDTLTEPHNEKGPWTNQWQEKNWGPWVKTDKPIKICHDFFLVNRRGLLPNLHQSSITTY